MFVGITFFSTLLLLCLRFQDISSKEYSFKQNMDAPRHRKESRAKMSPVSHIAVNCMSYSRPSATKIGKLLIEILKNLEGDGSMTQNLVDSLNRSRLFVGSSINDEEMFESLVKNTYYVAHGEPLSTFPRVMGIIWLLIADPSMNRKLGWCSLNKITSYISATNPSGIARKFAEQKHILSRARFMMEDFITDNAALHEYLKRDHSPKRKSNKIMFPRTRKRVGVKTEPIVSPNLGIEEFVENDTFELLKEEAQIAEENYPAFRAKANSLCVSSYLNLIMLLFNIIFIL